MHRTWRLVSSAILFLLLSMPSNPAKKKLTQTAINGPFQLAFDSKDNLYVAEYYGLQIVRIDRSNSSVSIVAGNGKKCCFKEGVSPRSVSVYGVTSMAVDSKGDIYWGVVNARDGALVRKIDGTTGAVNTVAGRPSPSIKISAEGVPPLQADARDPKGIAFTKDRALIVSVDMSNLLAKLGGGKATRVAGRVEKGYSGDGGLAINAKFDLPSSLASDAKGDLFVADYFNHRIRRIDAKSGIITTVAGNGSTHSSGDNGPAVEAGVGYVCGIAVDSQENVYLIEKGAGTIRRVDGETGFIRTIAGTGHQGFSGDGGQATEAEIAPAAIALDSSGDPYFSDIDSNRIRKVDAHTGIISTVVGNGLPKRKTIIE